MQERRVKLERVMQRRHGIYFIKQAAKELGVSEISVYQWVSGLRNPCAKNRRKIQKAYSISIEQIKKGFFN